jgi:hypothetical protein
MVEDSNVVQELSVQRFPKKQGLSSTYSAEAEAYLEIPLTRGYSVKVSPKDADLASGFPLFALQGTRGGVYAAWKPSYSKKTFLLHRVILNAPDGVWVDHRNHDTLDCTRSNIRLCSPAENAANSRHKVGVTGFRGVILTYSGKNVGPRYTGHVLCNGKRYRTTCFPTALEAAIARDALALELHQQYAVLNFPRFA